MSTNEHVLHCWADGPKQLSEEGDRLLGSTCLLLAGHEGEHEWTPDDEIQVQFLPLAIEGVGDEPPAA